MQFRGNSSDQAAAFRINLLASQGAQKKKIIIISKNRFKNAGKDTANDRNEKTTRF